jgi:hypothetical protein
MQDDLWALRVSIELGLLGHAGGQRTVLDQ